MFVKVIYYPDETKVGDPTEHLLDCQRVTTTTEENGSLLLQVYVRNSVAQPFEFLIPKDGSAEVYFSNDLGKTIDKLVFKK